MKQLLILIVLIWNANLSSQKIINLEVSEQGTIELTKEIAIPKISSGYTLWLPDVRKIKGMVVFFHSRRDTINSDFLIDYALTKHLAVIFTTTNNRLEFFFDKLNIQNTENYISEVINSHNIPRDKLLYCGMSLEGTRALRLAIYGLSDLLYHNIKPKAIAICDAPLDMVRFHKEMVKAKKLNFTSITANEGTWVSGYLESNLGGTPNDTLSAYVNYSPYCYSSNDGLYLDLFKNTAIRAYTEPDVNWWINTRRKDFYSMNAVDLAGLINELKIRGNLKADLIITQDKGIQPDGKKHPHSWSIVDEKELIDWFEKLIN